MTAQTAIAPGAMRPRPPSSSSTSRTGSNSRTLTSARPLKPLLAADTNPVPPSRPIALAATTSAAAASTSKPLPAAPTVVGRIATTHTRPSSNQMGRTGSSASTSSSGTTAATDRQSSTSPIDDEAGVADKVQPKREWVLPARAKPGRKPSEVEPPTKRKAQNRASQRAFRERKQSYVASLEEKIEAYERRAAGISSELQRVARRLKEENDGLRRENSTLRDRARMLEDATAFRRDQAPPSSTTSQLAARSKGRTPTAVQAPMLMLDETSSAGAWSWYTETGSNSEGDPVSKAITGMNRDCGFCTDQSPCLCSGEAVLDITGGKGAPAAAVKQEESNDEGAKVCDLPSRRSSQSSHTSAAALEGKQKLWYTVPSMGPPPAPPLQICPTTNERRARLPFRLGSSSNVLPPLQLTSQGEPKLWPVYSPIQASLDTNGNQLGTVPIYRLGRARGNSSSTAVCSGDPSHCNACSTDPALAAFCKAVAHHLSPDATGPSTPAILDAGNAMPLRNSRKRSHSSTFVHGVSMPPPSSPHSAKTTGTPLGISLYTNGDSTLRPTMKPGQRYSQSASQEEAMQSIPEAWRRIKQHPSFPKWQGGLDMLADVVSRRSSASSSLAAAEARRPRVDIERSSSIAMKFHRKSNDRSAEGAAADAAPATHDDSDSHNAPADVRDRDAKRPRLYVERESVEDALALLDRGVPRQREEREREEEEAGAGCVCPLNRTM